MENEKLSPFMESTIESIKNGRPCIKSISAQIGMMSMGGTLADSFKYFTLDESFSVTPLELSLKISYVPLMLSCIAFDYAEKAFDIIKKNKMYKLKPFTSRYMENKKIYLDETFYKCADIVKDSLKEKIKDILDISQLDITVYYYSTMNELLKWNKEFRNDIDRDITVYLCMAINIFEYIYEVDKEFDKELQKNMNEFYKNNRNMFASVVSRYTTINGCKLDKHLIECIDAVKDLCAFMGYEINDMSKTSIKIIRKTVDQKIEEISKSAKFVKEYSINRDGDDLFGKQQ